MHLATTEAANDLLAHDLLALLIGMLLDQQIPMEKAFSSPAVLKERLDGPLDAATIAAYEPEAFEALFRRPPALHRFPAAMAKRVQEMARAVVERYDGDVSTLWTDAADGADLVRRIAALPGFGPQKAKIFTSLLAKQFDVRPEGWQDAAAPYSEAGSFRSIADVVDDASLLKVRAFKQQQKAAAKQG